MTRRKTYPLPPRTFKPRPSARSKRSGGPPFTLPSVPREVVGAALVVLAVVTLVAFMSRGGRLTEVWLGALTAAFGWGAPVLPLLVGGIGAWLMLSNADMPPERRWGRPAGGMALFIAGLGLVHTLAANHRAADRHLVSAIARTMAEAGAGGGWVGYVLTLALTPNLGVVPTIATLGAVAALAACFAAGLGVNEGAALLARSTRSALVALWAHRPRLDGTLRWPSADLGRFQRARPAPVQPVGPGLAPAAFADTAPAAAPASAVRTIPKPPAARDAAALDTPFGPRRTDWQLPPVDQVLDPAVEIERSPDEAETMARTIESTLAEFGIPVKVVKINTGPTITQFGLKPGYVERAGQRTKVTVRRIVALHNDLALALAASPIRILAPVPGRPYVGVEVPNAAKALVSLRGVMEHEVFQKIVAGGGVPLALGRDTSGNPVAADLTRMPHLLVAGATGAGKSVCINALICSLLFTHTPDRLKLVLVDPKRVEMTQYRGLPHLATPVVVDVERIVGVLQWAVREMDRRYRAFADAGARNIELYNRIQADRHQPGLPFLVIIIDELADLMMLAPEETERLITRLAQLARATGIHLILATQRPSVDVVTGLIKANFPSRLAFAVSSSIDSRVILDTAGADKLLGRGDMLFMASDDSKLRRLQGCFVSDDEIERLTHYWKYAARSDPSAARPGAALDAALTLGIPEPMIQPELWAQMMDPQSGALAGARDPLWDEAVAVIRESRAASTSFLQRKLRIGYARAGRLMDQLEAAGLVGPAQGSGPREVHIDSDADVAAADDYRTRLDKAFGGAGTAGPGGRRDEGAGEGLDDLVDVDLTNIDLDTVGLYDVDADPAGDPPLIADDTEPPVRPWLEE